MIYLILIGLLAVTYIISPQQAEIAAKMLAKGFLLPIVTFVLGTVGWCLINLLTSFSHFDPMTWLYCCSFLGLPGATLVAWRLLSAAKD